jgi:acyl-CoA reductase-like NAD-dependent aldehyde dehydrogenase
MRELKLLVGGEWFDGERCEGASPYSGEVVSVVQMATGQLLERAVAAAERAASAMRALPHHVRADILAGMADRVQARRDELARAIRDEAAKPWQLALTEASRCADTQSLDDRGCEGLNDMCLRPECFKARGLEPPPSVLDAWSVEPSP